MQRQTQPDQPESSRRSAAHGWRLRWLSAQGASQSSSWIRARTTVGRDRRCDLVLEGEGVSRLHAELLPAEETLVVRDLGSTNGTFVDGVAQPEASLEPGALIRFGQWLALVERSGSPVDDAEFAELAPGMFGGQQLRLALDEAKRVAHSNLPIVVLGETGTGKELAARAIHDWSKRRGRYQAVNCAAIPERLIESELFGHERGAFTGADRAAVGHVRAANQGTLLLDEIEDLPLADQAKLLRVLQEREVTPVGASLPQPVDVRIVAASQRSLLSAVRAGRFREDLYMRLAGVEVTLPALRERIADIPWLVRRYWAEAHQGRSITLDARFSEALCLENWPGNLRQLHALVQRIAAQEPELAILVRRHLPPELRAITRRPMKKEPVAKRRASELSRLQRELHANGGNITKACVQLGITRQHGHRLLKQDALQREQLALLGSTPCES